MGNCLKSTTEDDNISFLRENIETSPRDSVDQVITIVDHLTLLLQRSLSQGTVLQIISSIWLILDVLVHTSHLIYQQIQQQWARLGQDIVHITSFVKCRVKLAF